MLMKFLPPKVDLLWPSGLVKPPALSSYATAEAGATDFFPIVTLKKTLSLSFSKPRPWCPLLCVGASQDSEKART